MTEELVKIRVRQLTSQRATVQYPDFRDGTRCGLRFRWSAFAELWYMWTLALDGTTIAGPVALVPGIDLFLGMKHDERVPQGELFVYSPDRLPPDLETVDVSAVLYYRRSTT